MMRLKGKKGGRRLEKQQQKQLYNIDTIASILSLVRVCQVTNAGLPHKMTYDVLFTGNFLKMRFSEFKSYQVTFDSFSSRCKGFRR